MAFVIYDVVGEEIEIIHHHKHPHTYTAIPKFPNSHGKWT